MAPALAAGPVILFKFNGFLQSSEQLACIYFGCVGSSLLRVGFLWLWQAGAPLQGWCVAARRADFSVAYGLRCPSAHGTFLDQDRTGVPVLSGGFLPTGPPGRFCNTCKHLYCWGRASPPTASLHALCTATPLPGGSQATRPPSVVTLIVLSSMKAGVTYVLNLLDPGT